MNAASSSFNPEMSPILESADPPTLLSRAWNLFRLHWRQCFLVILGPVILQATAGLLMNLMSTRSALIAAGENPAITAIMALTMVGMGFVLMVLGYFAWVIALAVLSRMFYLALSEDRTAPLKECFAAVGRRWLPLLAISVLAVVVMLVFGALDLAVLFLGGMGMALLSSFFTVALAAMNVTNYTILGAGMVILFILTFMLAGLVFFVMVSVQSLFTLMPIVSAVNAPVKKTFSGYWRGFVLLARNFPRTVLFGFLMLVLTIVISIVISFPAQAYIMFEIFLGAGKGDPAGFARTGALPLHAVIIANLYSVITGSIQGPFLFVALTLFWYDCQVRSEGLALKLKLRRMRERLNAGKTQNADPS